MKLSTILCLLIGFTCSIPLFSQENKTYEQALKQTQKLMQSKSKREAYIKGNAPATAADKALLKAIGGDSRRHQKAYELSSGIFATIVKKADGDPNKINQLVMELMKNPETLESMLTPAQRKQLAEMAKEVENEKFNAKK